VCEGCFKLHETPWLKDYPDHLPTDIFEVRFKNTRRSYYQNVNNLQLELGDIVAVEASPGHDIGIISLTGDMVAKQMRRTGFNPYNGEYKKIYRKAKPYDIERWQEAIALEHETMIRSRQIAAEMGLNMKIGDVEYQGDKIKAIFYYIADERVDFRELIKVFAEQFHIRIEMKQIGARQEAGRIGGIGACGRELCCASWISSFSSVTTNAARMQELSLNPQKLAGQCSKLKCCLVYEYDTYADARRDFPRVKEPLQALDGDYYLVKSDILARTMQFSSSKDALVNVVTLSIDRVKEIQALNRAGKKVNQLLPDDDQPTTTEEPTYRSEEDSITRFDNKRRNRDRRRRGDRNQNQPNQNSEQQPQPATENAVKTERPAGGTSSRGERRNRPRPERKPQSQSQGEAQSSPVAEAQPSQQSQGERPARDRQRWNRRDRQNRRDNRAQGENADNRAQQRGGEENRQRGERNNAKGEASTPKPNKTE
jgi:cell fate regulator YaaT (PSP1 superfamily)